MFSLNITASASLILYVGQIFNPGPSPVPQKSYRHSEGAANKLKSAAERSTRRRDYILLSQYGIEIPIWIEGAIVLTLNHNPDNRYEVIPEFIYDLSHANKDYADKTVKPLIERNPLEFWKLSAILLSLINVILLPILLGH